MRRLRWGLIITTTTNMHTATHAMPTSVPKMGQQAMVKRGPLAWENYNKFPLRPLGQRGFTRLLTHAVGDSTAAQWLPKIKDFLLHCRRSRVPMATSTQVDET